uniref:Uncharacterized protein n=1 Tax=Kalanchoe fedtschenkoi TaxID=63787 RepID=A0A7N0ZYE7_KALFE
MHIHNRQKASDLSTMTKRSDNLKDAVKFICTVEFWRMAICWTLSLLVSYFHLLFLKPRRPLPRRSIADATARPVCIITGATSGLGAAAAFALSKEGFHVVLVGRSLDLIRKTMQHIKERNEGAQLKAFQVDISSIESVLKFKDALHQWFLDSGVHSSVQLLINNAGILSTSDRKTPEGFDQMMGTNYIGAFYLTKLLLPLLKNSPTPSRIVNVTSFTHRSVFSVAVNKGTVGGTCFSNFEQYPYAQIYGLSKFFLLLFSYQLHREESLIDKSSQVSIIVVDPGAVKTKLMREVPSYISRTAFAVLKLLGLLQSPDSGARPIVDAALAPEEISGVYFFGGNGRTINSTKLSYDSKLARRLWSVTSDLLEGYCDRD